MLMALRYHKLMGDSAAIRVALETAPVLLFKGFFPIFWGITFQFGSRNLIW